MALDPNFLDAYINLGNVLKEARIFDRYEQISLLRWLYLMYDFGIGPYVSGLINVCCSN